MFPFPAPRKMRGWGAQLALSRTDPRRGARAEANLTLPQLPQINLRCQRRWLRSFGEDGSRARLIPCELSLLVP